MYRSAIWDNIQGRTKREGLSPIWRICNLFTMKPSCWTGWSWSLLLCEQQGHPPEYSGEQEINDRWHRYALGVWALVAFRACHLCVLADGAQLGGWLCTSSAACRLCRGIRGSPGTGQGKRPSQWVGRIGCLIPSPGHRLQSVQKAAERSFPGLLCLNCDKQILCKW